MNLRRPLVRLSVGLIAGATLLPVSAASLGWVAFAGTLLGGRRRPVRRRQLQGHRLHP